MDRRTVLRIGVLGAAGFGGAQLLAACGGGAPRASGQTGEVSTAPVTVADPSVPWWLRGNFAPVTREVEAFDLRVEGSLPAELSGLYVRNGSNPKPGWAPHWFLGDGMVHGVMLDDGKATWYRNRYVHTTLLAAGGGLTAKGAPGGAAGLSNVSIVHHGGKLLTLGEVGLPYELRPRDLSTVGAYDFGGRLQGQHDRAPEDRSRPPDQMHFFGYNFAEPYLEYHVADRDGVLVSSQPVAVKASTMIHDFAITDRDVVFWEMPVLFDMQLAIKMVSTAALDGHAVRVEAGVRVAPRRHAARRSRVGDPVGRDRTVLRVPRHERVARGRRGRARRLPHGEGVLGRLGARVAAPAAPLAHQHRCAQHLTLPRRAALRPRRRPAVDRQALHRTREPARLARRDASGTRRRRARGRGAHRRAVRRRDPLGSRTRSSRRGSGCSCRPARPRPKAS